MKYEALLGKNFKFNAIVALAHMQREEDESVQKKLEEIQKYTKNLKNPDSKVRR